MKYLEKLEAELRPMGDMLRDSLVQVASEIASLEQDLRELREARTRLQKLLLQVDPAHAPSRNGKPKARGLSEESYSALVTWLIANREKINEGAIAATSLYEDPDWMLIRDRSMIGKALKRAHSEGILTLSSVGQGGRRNYKFV
jgi:hypothetical protein